MPIVYEQARPHVHEMAAEILRDHYPKLRLGEGQYVKLCVLMASDEDAEAESESAVKLHGYPCAAVVSVIPYKQRVDKRADAEIVIDRGAWDDMTEPQQRALLDHEIYHLEIQTDDHGFVKTDDQGRPKLKLRLHDWQIGGFREIAVRHGDNAPEVIAARDFEEKYGPVVTPVGSIFAGR